MILGVGLLAVVFTIVIMFRIRDRFVPEDRSLSSPEPSTLVYRREDLQRIWEWEVAAGHYPSGQKSERALGSQTDSSSLTTAAVPETIGLTVHPINPALPPRKISTIPTRFRSPHATDTIGIGAKRVYLDIQSKPPNVAYPPRPLPGSVADMDVVMDHCDFSQNKVGSDLPFPSRISIHPVI